MLQIAYVIRKNHLYHIPNVKQISLGIPNRTLTERMKTMEKLKRIASLRACEVALEEELTKLKITSWRESCNQSRSCDRHHHCRWYRSSSSSSDGRTTSPDRRKRSKWSVRRFVEDHKDGKKLSSHELIESSCLWLVEHTDLSLGDVINFVKHIRYISGNAKSQRFVDSAHARYDMAVR